GRYAVLPNESDELGFRFGAERGGLLSPAVVPESTWAQDINGDGMVDLVVRSNGQLIVWLGKGNLEFESGGQTLPFLSASGFPLSVAEYELTFVDANKDGLQDVLGKNGNALILFANEGAYFQAQEVPALLQFDAFSGPPVIGDLIGSGNTEVAGTRQGA